MTTQATAARHDRVREGISRQARRHNEMRREALRACPEVRQLAGTQPLTASALPLLLAVHWTVAWAVSDSSILVVFLTSLLLGQVIIHSAGSLVHETAHRLIFRGASAKLAFDLGLEFILTSYAKQLTYQHEHISSHHPHLGEYERDYEHEDICAFQARQVLKSRHPRRQRLLTVLTLVMHALPLGFLIGDAVLPRLSAWASGKPVKDPARNIGATKPSGRQVALFVAVSIASNMVLFIVCGFYGLLYHVWSLSLFLGKLGITNLGQSLSEHAGSDDRNPTRSSYGWLNWLLFNTGYHSEHHSFPNVPWTRLPVLHRSAPGVFANPADRSYFGYWWDHVRNDFTASRKLAMHDQDHSARCAGIEPATADRRERHAARSEETVAGTRGSLELTA